MPNRTVRESIAMKMICALPSAGSAGAGAFFCDFTSNLILSSPQASGRIIFAHACVVVASIAANIAIANFDLLRTESSAYGWKLFKS
jgi:hypothetical protein